MRGQATWVAVALACAACGGATREGELARQGVHIAPESGAGWYRLRTDEGYTFSMPGLPLAEREDFYFGGAAVPERFFDLRTEAGSRGYLVRVFDARSLSPADRDALREQALDLFLPTGSRIRERRPRADGGEELFIEGYSDQGHSGLLRSVVLDGLVWEMLVVMAPGSGAPSDAQTFFQSARTSR